MTLGTHRIGDSGRRQHGASLVEFAIIAPLLLMLIFGIVEMSRAIFAYTVVWSAARDGARHATTSDGYLDCAAIDTAAREKAATFTLFTVDIEYLDPSTSPATLIADCQGGTPPAYQDPDGPAVTGGISRGDVVEVTTRGTFDSVIPIIEVFLDGLVLESTQRRAIFIEEVVGGP